MCEEAGWPAGNDVGNSVFISSAGSDGRQTTVQEQGQPPTGGDDCDSTSDIDSGRGGAGVTPHGESRAEMRKRQVVAASQKPGKWLAVGAVACR